MLVVESEAVEDRLAGGEREKVSRADWEKFIVSVKRAVRERDTSDDTETEAE